MTSSLVLADPIDVLGHARVDTGREARRAAVAPRHNARQLPHAVFLADQGSATVALNTYRQTYR